MKLFLKIVILTLVLTSSGAKAAEECLVRTSLDLISPSLAEYNDSIRAHFITLSNKFSPSCAISDSLSTLYPSGATQTKAILFDTPELTLTTPDFEVKSIMMNNVLSINSDFDAFIGNPSESAAKDISDLNSIVDYTNQTRVGTYSQATQDLLKGQDFGFVVLDFRTNFKNLDFNPKNTAVDGDGNPVATEDPSQIDWTQFPIQCQANSKTIGLINTIILLPDSFYAKFRNDSYELKKIIFDKNNPATGCLRDYGANYICVGKQIGDPVNATGTTIAAQNNSWCEVTPGPIEPWVPNFDDLVTGSGELDGSMYYPDVDQDSFGDASSDGVYVNHSQSGVNFIPKDENGNPFVTDNTDCDDSNASVNPIAREICDGIDNNCDGLVDQTKDGSLECVWYMDLDGDGYAGMRQSKTYTGFSSTTDCKDTNPAINPSATEICGNGVDENCDGLDDSCTGVYYDDIDGDGYGDDSTAHTTPDADDVAIGGDCNDLDPAINPAATEICGNTIDENCDGLLDSCGDVYYDDIDGDGYGDDSTAHTTTTPDANDVATGGDCNDGDSTINPGASEICGNKVDENCDGTIETTCTYYDDIDGDGYGDDSTADTTPGPGDVTTGGDCNDSESTINPGATEICGNTIDENCDGLLDSCGEVYYDDADGDGYGDDSTEHTTPDADDVTTGGDCNDGDPAINPGAFEICGNNIDEDCSGDSDENCFGGEVCDDGADNDANGLTDCDDTASCDCSDLDDDGFTIPEGDCNDANPSINPDAEEVCNLDGIDFDCDGLVNEDNVCVNPATGEDIFGSGNILAEGGTFMGCSLSTTQNQDPNAFRTIMALFLAFALPLFVFRKKAAA